MATAVLPEERYTRVAMLLHWAIAFFIIFNLSLGYFMEGFPPPFKMLVISLHVSAGISVLVLTLVRVVWRLMHEPPLYPAEMKRWERHSAHFVHLCLYVGMVLMPLTGWALVSAHPPVGSPGAAYDSATRAAGSPGTPPGAAPMAPGAKPPPRRTNGIKIWGLFTLPTIAAVRQIGQEAGGVEPQRKLHDTLVDWHGFGGFVMIALLLLHVVGAVKHQFMDRQPELDRMGIRTRRKVTLPG